jgi:hypothetical protein
MTELKLSTGKITSDKKLTMNKLTAYYTNLYRNDDNFESNQAEALLNIMEVVKSVITSDQLTNLSSIPIKEEIEDTIKLLASDKAPGSDGLTVEVIRACRDFIGEEMYKVILEFWKTEQLYPELLQGIIRLLPKKLDKINIKDWRPLTLLQIIYKIIAKLLAVRLGVILPDLISIQQTGFVPGRQILDNISIAYLMHNWTSQTNTQLLFLSLDFRKALD